MHHGDGGGYLGAEIHAGHELTEGVLPLVALVPDVIDDLLEGGVKGIVAEPRFVDGLGLGTHLVRLGAARKHAGKTQVADEGAKGGKIHFLAGAEVDAELSHGNISFG